MKKNIKHSVKIQEPDIIRTTITIFDSMSREESVKNKNLTFDKQRNGLGIKLFKRSPTILLRTRNVTFKPNF